MKILGINDAHNASACVVEDGVVRAALQEERLTRVKNEFCFPHRAVEWVLSETDTKPQDVDYVAMSSHHITSPWNSEALMAHLASLRSPKTKLRRLARLTPAMDYVRRKRRSERMAEIDRAGLPPDRARFVDHHTAHAAAAYQGAPFSAEDTLVLTADGEGDGLCASVRIGSAGLLNPPLATVAASHSVGFMYSMVTFLLGMVPYEHEYKLMGLAPYASERGAAEGYRRFAGLFEFEDSGLSWRRASGVPDMFYSDRFFLERLRYQRFDNIAAGMQRYTEEHMLQWVRHCVRATGIRRLAVGGGVFMNVKLNKAIAELDEVEDVFVFPSCGDETNSMGSAFHVYAQVASGADRRPAITPIGNVYWGPEPGDDRLPALIDHLRRDGYHVTEPEDIDVAVADLLADGAIVARARGRMEFGARALGNRSILADPTQPDAVKIINAMVKKRDFWMPFAPAILAEHSNDYLVNPKKVPSPYMIMAFDTTKRRRDFPAAIHPYDETARPQLVTEDHNPDFHRLISRFHERTGRAVLLNTSFNLHGFPIVSSAEDAIGVLRESGLRYLAVDRYLISKSAESHQRDDVA